MLSIIKLQQDVDYMWKHTGDYADIPTATMIRAVLLCAKILLLIAGEQR